MIQFFVVLAMTAFLHASAHSADKIRISMTGFAGQFGGEQEQRVDDGDGSRGHAHPPQPRDGSGSIDRARATVSLEKCAPIILTALSLSTAACCQYRRAGAPTEID